MINADVDIISGLYIQRKPGQHILEIYKATADGGTVNTPIEELYNKGITEIAACGFGCCLIKQTVFTTLTYPHFYYKSALDHKDTISEDVYFCLKAKAAGFKIWADPSIICDHIGNTKFVVQLPQLSHLETIAQQDLLPREHAEYLKQMNIQPKVIYDIGACVLHWTRKAVEVWPSAKYYLFDAAESSHPFFGATPYSYYIGPLSDVDGKTVKFYQDNQNPGGNSYYKETTGHYNEDHAIMKTAFTLDTVIEYNKWEWPDLIKMDIQGAELDVIKGSPKAFASAKDVILEAQHVDYNEGAPKADEIIAYMKTIGFELVSNFCKGDVDGDYHFTKG